MSQSFSPSSFLIYCCGFTYGSYFSLLMLKERTDDFLMGQCPPGWRPEGRLTQRILKEGLDCTLVLRIFLMTLKADSCYIHAAMHGSCNPWSSALSLPVQLKGLQAFQSFLQDRATCDENIHRY